MCIRMYGCTYLYYSLLQLCTCGLGTKCLTPVQKKGTVRWYPSTYRDDVYWSDVYVPRRTRSGTLKTVVDLTRHGTSKSTEVVVGVQTFNVVTCDNFVIS